MADATMQDLIKEVKLVSLTETRATQDVHNAVRALNKNVLDFINLQKQAMLDQLEAAREASNKQAGQQSRSESSKRDSGGGLGIPGLAGFAIPALVGLVASLTEADQLLRAFALPKIFKGLVRVVSGIADGVRDAWLVVSTFPEKIVRAFNAIGDLFPKITFDPNMLSMRLQNFILDIGVKIEQIGNAIGDFFKAAKEGAIARAQRIADAVGDFFRPVRQAFDDFKAGTSERVAKIFETVTETIKNIKTAITESFDNIGKSIKSFFTFDGPPGFITKIFDDVKSVFNAFKIEMPDWIKDFKIPGLETIKGFFVGADAGGGIMGFFNGLLDFAKPLLAPLKAVGRHIFGPISQIIMGIVDFFVGFYEGFVGNPEYDEDGNLVGDSRSFMEKIGDGLIGGVKGLIKGITEAIDLILVGIPAWIAEQLGFKEFAEKLNKFWEEGGLVTRFVDPFIDFILNFPTILMDLLPSFEDIKKMMMEFAERLDPRNWSIFGGSSDPAEEAKEKLKRDEAKRQKELENAEKMSARIKDRMARVAANAEDRDGNRTRDLTQREKNALAKMSADLELQEKKAAKLREELGIPESKPESKMAEPAEIDPKVPAHKELKDAQNEKEEAQANADKKGAPIVDASSKTSNQTNASLNLSNAPPQTKDREASAAYG